MTREEAIRILDPVTTGEALAEIEYYNGFNGKTAAVQAVSDACVLAVAALREQGECAVYSCLSPLYGWHISDLKIYDKPKRITQFKGNCRLKNSCLGCPDWNYQMADCNGRTITRPPQSWCYVEG